MCSSSSSQVITPGVASGATKPGHVHFGYAPTSLHISSQTPASLFCTRKRCFRSSAAQAWLPWKAFTLRDTAFFWSADACLVHALIESWPQYTRLSICSSSSSQVITPGVGSGATKPGHVHFGYAPTSLHISSQTPASLFWSWARRLRSSVVHACSSWTVFTWSADACLCHALMESWPQYTRLSMCSSSSSQVITPGVASGATKPGHVHFGYAPTSLHISSQTPASLFC